MRTDIEIDDQLMAKAMRRSGQPTKRAAVDAGLCLLLHEGTTDWPLKPQQA